MHRLEYPAATLERLRARRGGRLEVFPTIAAARTALVVIDMQHFFCGAGQPGSLTTARAIVPNINRLAEATRQAGGTVVWVVTTFTSKSAATWSTFFDHFCTPALKATILDGLRDGGVGHALYQGLDARPTDLRIEKDRFSAFVAGSSRLHEHLLARRIDTLLIAGTVTNICCEATARDAAMMNYKVIMVSDANAAANDEQHVASLMSLNGSFADIQTTDAVIGKLQNAAARAAE
ncbi:MAG: cysteine hydrolase [Alphaproteobacteria bacterium]|nr:cysteine hydrolase [Alphaproteobacteria bacterium]